jgi:hypothetical protein
MDAVREHADRARRIAAHDVDCLAVCGDARVAKNRIEPRERPGRPRGFHWPRRDVPFDVNNVQCRAGGCGKSLRSLNDGRGILAGIDRDENGLQGQQAHVRCGKW